MKFIDKIGIAVGLSATIIILFFLVYDFNSCFILFEPKLPIRIIEIIWCIFGGYIMIKLLWNKNDKLVN